jgi:L-threonylcarbamoyladenylate synthase
VVYRKKDYALDRSTSGLEKVLAFSFENAISTGKAIASGDVAIIPTDTLYGLVASVRHPKSIEYLYRLKKRDPAKPCIILLPDTDGLREFLSQEIILRYETTLSLLWPGAISAIFPCKKNTPHYLTRGGNSLAFRIPQEKRLLELLRASGPIIAPSANREGESPAQTTQEARDVFGNKIDHYLDDGVRAGKASTLLSFSSDGILLLREGECAPPNLRDIITKTYQ